MALGPQDVVVTAFARDTPRFDLPIEPLSQTLMKNLFFFRTIL